MPDVTQMPPPDGRIHELKVYLDRLRVAKHELDVEPPKGLEAHHITVHTALNYSIAENERLLRDQGVGL